MIDPTTILTMVCVAVIIGFVFAALAMLANRGSIAPETSRKAAHIAVGLVAVSFGWLFEQTFPVVVLCAGGLIFALAVRRVALLRRTIGPVLHSVQRRSMGDYCIPIVVPLLHWLAMPDRVYFVVPILVLTLADSAAALIGSRFGRWAYRTDEGSKTLEGSAALAAVTASIIFSALLFEGFEWPRSATLALLMAILVMLAEAVCWRGLDNLVLPLGSFALLKTYEHLPDEMIVDRIAVSVAITAFACVWHRKAGIIGAAGVAAAFVIYACWAIGGIVWAVPPLVLLVCLPYFGVQQTGSREDDIGVGPVLSMSATPLAWMFLHSTETTDSTLLPFTAAWTAVLGITWIVRHRRDAVVGQQDRMLTLKVFGALAAIAILCFALPGGAGRASVVLTATVSAFLLAFLAEYALDSRRRLRTIDRAWTARALVVLIASTIATGIALPIERL